MMEPRLIEFPVYKDPKGNLVVADYDDLPFEVKRAFWVYDFKHFRGNHALKTCHQLIVLMSGIIAVRTLHGWEGNEEVYTMKENNVGLYLPPIIWREIGGEPASSYFVLASHPFDEDDYIHEFDEFLKELRK